MFNPTHAVSCTYGAPMGRYDRGGDPGDDRLYLRRLPLDSGGYDRGGAYWGHGASMYAAFDSKGGFARYLRADSRKAAKAAILEDYPDALFWR